MTPQKPIHIVEQWVHYKLSGTHQFEHARGNDIAFTDLATAIAFMAEARKKADAYYAAADTEIQYRLRTIELHS